MTDELTPEEEAVIEAEVAPEPDPVPEPEPTPEASKPGDENDVGGKLKGAHDGTLPADAF
jgi:hypothetical protein